MKTSDFVRRCVGAGLLALRAAWGQGDDSLIFPLPEILKPNVEFWTRIYAEISLNEGLLHDRDYPRCVYGKLSFGSQRSPERSRMIEERREALAQCIERIANQPDSAWTADDRRIHEIMRAAMPQEQIASAAERLRFQQGQKERFLEGLRRSGAYLDTIRAVFSQYGIPSRVAYLPHVESSFNIEAYSKVGAAGMWQFMPSTGRLFLTINYLVDERRDPFLSTIAAAKLLRKNYDELGAWPLAITAYNHGLGGMKSAVALTGSRDIAVVIQKHTSRSFQFASKNFYSCFLAASAIAADPQPYFGNVEMAPRMIVHEMTIDKHIPASVICSYLGISPETLQKLNPALRPIVFQHQRSIPAGYRLRLPADMPSETAVALLNKVPDSLKSAELPRPKYYQVERGDNLYAIAARLNVPVRMLAEENGIDLRHRIYAGQVLRVPPTASAPATAIAAPEPAVTAEETLLALTTAETPAWIESAPPKGPESAAVERPAPAPQPVKPQAAPAKPPARDAVADVYAMPATALTDSIMPSRQEALTQFDVSIYNLDVTLAPAGDHAEIRVSVDETIGHYAEWLGVGAHRIRELNRLGKGSAIHINQRLSIPLGKGGLDRFVAARLEHHMALEEDFFSRYKVVEARPRIIARGQTLWDICNSEEPVPLWLFKKYNKRLDLATLVPGAQVWIPVIAEKTAADAAETPAVAPSPMHRPYREPLRPASRTVSPAP